METYDYPDAIAARDFITTDDNPGSAHLMLFGRRFYRKSLVVIGQSNPYGANSRYALYPYPANSAGGRLFRLAADAVAVAAPAGLFPAPTSRPSVSAPRDLRAWQWVALTDRYNLCVGEWSAGEAAKHSQFLQQNFVDGRPVILLGARVANAWWCEGTPPPLYEVVQGVVTIPHTSGRNRAWNDPDTYISARDAVARAIGDAAEWPR